MDRKYSYVGGGANKKTKRPVSARSRVSERALPATYVDSGATTTDNETSEASQYAIDSSVLTSDSSSGSLAMNQMPSVIDLSGTSQKAATNDEVFMMMQSHGGENRSVQSPQIDESTKQSAPIIPAHITPTTDAQQTLTEAQSKTKSRFQGRYESSVFCRICHEVGSSDLFISPCDCKGSLSLVHKHCLERWLAESNSSLCELCGYEYLTRRLPRHNAVGSVFAWLLASGNSRERRLLLWDIFSLIVLLPLAVMGTSLGMKVLSKDVVGRMTGIVLAYTRFLQLAMIIGTITLDAGILTWTLIRIQYHFLQWYHWYNRNCKVILLGYPEPQTAPAVQHISSATVREIQF